MPVPRRLIGTSVAVLIVLVLAGGIYLRITGSDTPEEATNPSEGGENAPDVSADASFATDLPIPVEGAVVRQDTLVGIVWGGQPGARHECDPGASDGRQIARVSSITVARFLGISRVPADRSELQPEGDVTHLCERPRSLPLTPS